MAISHQNNFATNLTSDQVSGVTTTPLDSIPSVDAEFYLAFDATNVNSKYEVVKVTSKTATNVNHAATTYAHTTAEEVRMVVPAEELDSITTSKDTGWNPVSDTWTYASVDDPTGVITVPSDATDTYSIGMRISFVNGGNTIYGIITAVTSTTITFLHEIDPTDSQALTLMANSAITVPQYSTQKAPFGFPMSKYSWQIEASMSSNNSQNTPTQNTWYNLGGSISVPIGAWNASAQALIYGYKTSTTNVSILATLSSANNTDSDSRFKVRGFTSGATGTIEYMYPMDRTNFIIVTSKETRYLNVLTDTSSANQIAVRGDTSPALITLDCAYL